MKKNLIRLAVVAVLLSSSPKSPKAWASPQATQSRIHHLVVILQENHSFDSYFGRYCQASSGSNPTCTDGSRCCEAGPAREPGGALPVKLDDEANVDFDPDHSQRCELEEMHGGRMDRFVSGAYCSNPRNFAYADRASASVYWELADHYALADRYFQPVAGASSSNDMYLARAQFVFDDNAVEPQSAGSTCGADPNSNRRVFTDPTIGDLLSARSVPWAFYAEGYQATLQALERGSCPAPDPACPWGISNYPCIYDPSDNPFQYYRSSVDNPRTMRDYAAFGADLASGTLPAVSFIKALGYKTEHPGSNIAAGMSFVSGVVKTVAASSAAADTLVLITFDESGGFFDHVTPPGVSPADGKPYGPRIPLLAVGPFARRGYVSHVPMEHSSIVRFIEWNWLEGRTGQLRGRDALVYNIGSLLDPAAAGAVVPIH